MTVGLLLLIAALIVAAGLAVAISWRHFDLLREENDSLHDEVVRALEEARAGWADAREGWAAAAAAQHRVAELLASDDEFALAHLHATAACEGLVDPGPENERWN